MSTTENAARIMEPRLYNPLTWWRLSGAARLGVDGLNISISKRVSTLDLLQRARAGDREALDRLFGRYLVPLQRWASGRLPRWTRNLLDTDDLVQDTLMNTLGRIGSFEQRGEGALQAYLRQAVLNRVQDQIRMARRKPGITALSDGQADQGPSPLEEAVGQEAIRRYESALQRLRPEDRAAIVGRVEMGFSYEQLLEELDKPSIEAVRMAVSRALVRLAREMSLER